MAEEWTIRSLDPAEFVEEVPREPLAQPKTPKAPANEELNVGPTQKVFEAPLHLRQERTRLLIVGSLLVIFGALVATAIAATIFERWPAEKMLGLLLAPVSGLLGTALGFYFRIEQQHARHG